MSYPDVATLGEENANLKIMLKGLLPVHLYVSLSILPTSNFAAGFSDRYDFLL